MADAEFNAERVRELLDYDPETGQFRWKIKRKRSQVGDLAGGLNSDGYMQFNIGGTTHYGHRLAWLHAHGAWPEGDIDHRNGDRADNRIANLRVVTRAVNLQNLRAARSDNESGLLGASMDKRRGKWRARLKTPEKTYWLGFHNTAEEAHAVYLEAKRRLHEGCTI